jgi:hypothetical protein
MAWRARIGVWKPLQISAPSGRTSATAHSVSSGAWLAGAKSNSASTIWAPCGGGSYGVSWAFNWARIDSLLSWSIGPGPKVTSRTLTPIRACSKVSATTATPLGRGTTARTPGMAITSTLLLIDFTAPLTVGERRTMAGLAVVGLMSIENFLAPVTMSRESTRRVGRPISLYSATGFGVTRSPSTGTLAASSASSP